MTAQTPAEFNLLFDFTQAILSQAILPTIDPEGDPPPMLIVLFQPGDAPAAIGLPPILAGEKDFFAMALAAFVQELDAHACAFVFPAWLRSATPNEEIIIVSCNSREIAAMGLLGVAREPGNSPTIVNPRPPKVADIESGRFTGPYHQDVSSLPEDLRDGIRDNARDIREQHEEHQRNRRPN